ncbi:MAG TPA: hypothetical protein VHM20_08650, partial [Gammaproteobacteria bacterium]|nr:hypothetical protein [Gammaproteobacteria bacterium]
MSTPRGTKPGYIKSHAEIQPGDIIFFPSSGYMVSSIIEGAQKYFIPKKEDGHANSTHVAICTGHDEKGVPLISHMVMPAYEQIPLTGYLKWYAGND